MFIDNKTIIWYTFSHFKADEDKTKLVKEPWILQFWDLTD